MMTPAVTYTPAEVTHAEEMKKVLIEVFADDSTRIAAPAAILLYTWAHNMKPDCRHKHVEGYSFNTKRFSGSCLSCGADVRSEA
jgi:hypothetical protein